MHYGIEFGRTDIVEFLFKESDKHDPLCLWMACRHGHADCVKFLIDDKAVDVSTPTPDSAFSEKACGVKTLCRYRTGIDLAIDNGHWYDIRTLVFYSKGI